MDIAGVAGALEVSTGVQFEVEGVELSVTGSSGNWISHDKEILQFVIFKNHISLPMALKYFKCYSLKTF